MREIKFRAWHHGGGDHRVKGSMTYSYPFPVIFWEQIEDEVLSVEIMQYTGLHDKNGKEIYEGDILKTIGFSKNWEIKWDYEMLYRIQEYLSISEIIGNIHENPEIAENK